MDLESPTLRHGMAERRFTSKRSGRRIPGVLWSTVEPAEGPFVLLGHGGSGSVDDDHIVGAARHLVREVSATCLAIDGPVHGGRRAGRDTEPSLVLLEFSSLWSTDETMTAEMVADWRHVLDEVLGDEDLALGGLAIGYWGLSMGTLLGLPLVAAEPRIKACVLGLAGAVGPTRDELIAAARACVVPTFFLMKLEDELFTRESCMELFDLIGAQDKQLHVSPGRHAEVGAEAFGISLRFLAGRLALAAAP